MFFKGMEIYIDRTKSKQAQKGAISLNLNPVCFAFRSSSIIIIACVLFS